MYCTLYIHEGVGAGWVSLEECQSVSCLSKVKLENYMMYRTRKRPIFPNILHLMNASVVFRVTFKATQSPQEQISGALMERLMPKSLVIIIYYPTLFIIIIIGEGNENIFWRIGIERRTKMVIAFITYKISRCYRVYILVKVRDGRRVESCVQNSLYIHTYMSLTSYIVLWLIYVVSY